MASPTWPSPTIPPLLTLTLAISYALLIISYPPRHRSLAFTIFLIPTAHAFTHHLHITPWFTINDTLGRMLYIWTAYMSYAFLMAKYKPCLVEGGGWTVRLRQARKVLYTKRLARYYPCCEAVDGGLIGVRKKNENEKRDDVTGRDSKCRNAKEPSPRVDRIAFALHHGAKALFYLTVNYLVDTYATRFAPAFHTTRASPWRTTLLTRAAMTWDVCIADALYFSSLYSCFAIVFVSVLHLDDPSEWTPPLFGSLTNCYTVRRYWGVYWHDFIREAFPAHVRLVTRRVCGLNAPSAVRRFVENAAVFVVSGLMHALVRCVQTQRQGEVWCVAVWYAAQMFPIVVEGVVQDLWRRFDLRARVRARVGARGVRGLGRGVGFVWTFGWMFWSVSTYLLARHAWEVDDLKRRYPDLFGRTAGV